MSPAAVDFRSPITSSQPMQSKPQQPFASRNPNSSPHVHFGFDAFSSSNLAEQLQDTLPADSQTSNGFSGLASGFVSPFASRVSTESSNFSAVTGRSKPRLMKTRKKFHNQQRKSISVVEPNDADHFPFVSVSEESNKAEDSSKYRFDCAKVDDVKFVFAAKESSNSSSNTGLNSNIEQRLGARSAGQSTAFEFRRSGSTAFVFCANMSGLISEKRECSLPVGQPRADAVRRCNRSDSDTNLEHIESNKDVRQSGMNFVDVESMSYVFTTSKNSSLLNSNLENIQCSGSSAKSEADEFIMSDHTKKVNSENCGSHSGFVKTLADNMDSVLNNKYNFVSRGSVNTFAAPGTSMVCELSDEVRKLSVEDCEKVSFSDKATEPKINSCDASDHVYVFESKKQPSASCTENRTSSHQLNNSNWQGPGNDGAAEKTEGISGRNTEEHVFVHANGGLRDSDGQTKLGDPCGIYPHNKQPANADERSSDQPCVGISTKPFTFQAGNSKSSDGQEGQPGSNAKWNRTSNQPSFSSTGLGFERLSPGRVENKEKFTFSSIPMGKGPSAADFTTPNQDTSYTFAVNLSPGLTKKLQFSERSRSIRDKRLNKTRGKLRQAIPAHNLTFQGHALKEESRQNKESTECYSPMDFSPYQDNCDSSIVNATSRHAKPTKGSIVSEGDKNFREPNEAVPTNYCKEAETGCHESKSEQISINGGGGSVEGDGISSNTRREESECSEQFYSASSTEDKFERSFTFSATFAQGNVLATNHQNRRKYRRKHAGSPNCSTQSRKKFDEASSLAQSSHLDNSYLHPNQSQDREGNASNSPTEEDKSKGDKDDNQGILEVCEKWRLRGNQLYEKGHLPKAEEFYTKGIISVSNRVRPGFCMEPLVLCYSNRAAARMARGKMREALEDCRTAVALDPNFLKVQIRAANCHLALGEIEDAQQYFNKCLESARAVCLDRRITIEASNGLQMAQKVAECMNRCAELLQQRTSNCASSALEIILEVLSISYFSEKLHEMKGEALLMLRRYEEVIQFCEQTLASAEKNFVNKNLADGSKKISAPRIWRLRLMSKSYFHLGKLEMALDLLEKQEQMISTEDRSSTQESSIPFAATVRELLHHKNAGNEAFQCGRHADAVDHYTTVISSNIESHPFAAICFCNRAAAHQALGQLADAIADCSLAIALDGNYRKAVSRRATLHETIRDYEQAAGDLHRLISLLGKPSLERAEQSGTPDRSTGSTGKELRQARSRLSSVEEKAKNGVSLDYYLILGIKPSDSAADIRKAYRKAALRHHPDKAGQFLARCESRDDGQRWKKIADEVHKDADRLFKMIGEAYEVLSDSTKRSQYDLQEELRNAQKESNGSRYSSGHTDHYSSHFESSANRRHWKEAYRTYGKSRSQW